MPSLHTRQKEQRSNVIMLLQLFCCVAVFLHSFSFCLGQTVDLPSTPDPLFTYFPRLTIDISLHDFATVPSFYPPAYDRPTEKSDALSSVLFVSSPNITALKQLRVTMDFAYMSFSRSIYVPPGATDGVDNTYIWASQGEAGWAGILELPYPTVSGCAQYAALTKWNEPWAGKIVLTVADACPWSQMAYYAYQAGALGLLAARPNPILAGGGTTGNDEQLMSEPVFSGNLYSNIPGLVLRYYDGKFLSTILGQDNALQGLRSNLTVYMPGAGQLAQEEWTPYLDYVSSLTMQIVPFSGVNSYATAAAMRLDPCMNRMPGMFCRGYPAGHINVIVNIFLTNGTLPASFPGFPYLEILALQLGSGVPITTVTAPAPINFAKMPRLKMLAVNSIDLSGAVDSSICTVSSLSYIYFASTALTSLPDCINQMTQLNFFRIIVNPNLNHLPASMTNLQNLAVFDVHQNALKTLPAFNLTVCNLRFFWTYLNSIRSGLPNFQNCNNLLQIDISSNAFTGNVQSAFDNIQVLSTLNLQHNSFSGPLPNLIGSVALTTLSASHNNFVGDAPTSWNVLTALSSVDISYNALTGPFSVFRSLTGLLTLVVSHNQFAVSAMVTLGSAFPPAVKYVDYSYNQISVPLLFDSSPMGTMETLIISNNQISCIQALTFTIYVPKLQYLDLSYNNLSSSCPFFTLTGGLPIVTLMLQGNPNFGGSSTIPSGLFFMTSQYIKSLATQPFSCPTLGATLLPLLTIEVDPTFYKYSACICDRGSYGYPPLCPTIPSQFSYAYNAKSSSASAAASVLQDISASSFTSFNSVSNNSSAQISVAGLALADLQLSNFMFNGALSAFTDAIFGSARLSPGIDIVLEVNPTLQQNTLPAMPLGIALDVAFNISQFNEETDVLSVYTGASDLSGELVAQITGTSLQNAVTALLKLNKPTGASSYVVTSVGGGQQIFSTKLIVNAPNAALNFRSRKQAGQLFAFNFTVQFTCPNDSFIVQFDSDYGEDRCIYVQPTYTVAQGLPIFIYTVTALVLMLIFLVLCVVVWKRNTVVIRASSPHFCLVILLALAVMNSAAIPFSMSPTDSATCHVRAWLLGLGLIGVLSAALTKAVRILRIFNNKIMKDITGMSNLHLALVMAAQTSAELALLLAYSIKPLTSATTENFTSGGKQYQLNVCGSMSEYGTGFTAWLIVQFIYIGAFLVLGIYISWSLKQVPAAFNESAHIASVLAALFFVCAIIVPTNFVVDTPEALLILRGLGLNGLSLIILLGFFGPKLLYIYQGRENDRSLLNANRAGPPGSSNKGAVSRQSGSNISEQAAGATGAVHRTENSHGKRVALALGGDDLLLHLQRRVAASDYPLESKNRFIAEISQLRENLLGHRASSVTAAGRMALYQYEPRYQRTSDRPVSDEKEKKAKAPNVAGSEKDINGGNVSLSPRQLPSSASVGRSLQKSSLPGTNSTTSAAAEAGMELEMTSVAPGRPGQNVVASARTPVQSEPSDIRSGSPDLVHFTISGSTVSEDNEAKPSGESRNSLGVKKSTSAKHVI